MFTLGTTKIWKPLPSNIGKSQKESQILKNQGYISIYVKKVFYNSNPSFFQNIFGGKDKIAITTSAIYKTSEQQDIEAKIVIGAAPVKAKSPSTFSKDSTIALKVPTHADGIELKTTITSIKKDNFESTIELLSDKSFQAPLSLDPTGVGKVLTIAKLINQIFASDKEKVELEGSFAGLISKESIEHPVINNRLTEGYLILVSNQDKNNPFLNNFNPDNLHFDEVDLTYDGKKVDRTHIIYSIQFERMKGENHDSIWSAHYEIAYNELDDILEIIDDEDEKKRIWKKAYAEWKSANILLNNDPTFIKDEKRAIKQLKLLELKKKFKENSIDNFFDMNTITEIENLVGSPDEQNNDKLLEATRGIDSDELNYMDKLWQKLEQNVNNYISILNE